MKDCIDYHSTCVWEGKVENKITVWSKYILGKINNPSLFLIPVSEDFLSSIICILNILQYWRGVRECLINKLDIHWNPNVGFFSNGAVSNVGQTILCWGSCSKCCRMFSNFPVLYPLATSSLFLCPSPSQICQIYSWRQNFLWVKATG